MDTEKKIQISYMDPNNHAKKFTIAYVNNNATNEKLVEFGKKTMNLTKNTYVSTSVITTTKLD